MAIFELEKTTFEPHPEGTFEGHISEVRDMGKQDTKFGPRPRIAIIIQNHDLAKGDGQPWLHWEFCNLASGKNSRLTTLRQKLLRRALTPEELRSFDPEAEMIGRDVSFQIEHAFGERHVFANLISWSLRSDEGARKTGDSQGGLNF